MRRFLDGFDLDFDVDGTVGFGREFRTEDEEDKGMWITRQGTWAPGHCVVSDLRRMAWPESALDAY